MRKFWIFAALLLSCAVNSPAQLPAPGAEIFGGYSYIRINSGPFNANGWEGSLTGNFNRFFGLEADFNQTYGAPGADRFAFLFGPHLAFRAIPRVTPFVHLLVGGTRRSVVVQGPPPVGTVVPPLPSSRQRETDFTTAAGGGLDVKATRFIWIRVIQVDYLRQFFSNQGENNVRISAGIVFRFGR